jgi:hypothetical protein
MELNRFPEQGEQQQATKVRLDPTRRRERALDMAEKAVPRTFSDSSMPTLPPKPKDPSSLYILQSRTDSVVPKEMMSSWATATKHLEELLEADALRHKAWAANGILQMHLDGQVRIRLCIFGLFCNIMPPSLSVSSYASTLYLSSLPLRLSSVHVLCCCSLFRHESKRGYRWRC